MAKFIRSQIEAHRVRLQSFTLNVLGQGILLGINGSTRDTKVLHETSTAYGYKHNAAWQKLVEVATTYHRDHSWKKDDNPPLPFPRWWKDDTVKEFHLSHWVGRHLAAGVSAGPSGRIPALELTGLDRPRKISIHCSNGRYSFRNG